MLTSCQVRCCQCLDAGWWGVTLLVMSWESGTAGTDEVELCAVCTKGLYKWMLGINWRSVILSLWSAESHAALLCLCVSFDRWCTFILASIWKCVIAITAFTQRCTNSFPGCSFSAHAVSCSKHNISLSATGPPELTVRGIGALVGRKSLLHVASEWWRGDTCLILNKLLEGIKPIWLPSPRRGKHV